MSVTNAKIILSAKDKTKAAFKSINRNFGGLRSNALRLTGAFGAIAGIGGMGAMISSSISAGAKIDALSTRLGASTEALSQYMHVAEQTEVTFETLTMGWQRMTRRVAEAARGTGEARDALRELGIDAKQLKQLAPEEQFEVIADAMQGVGTQSDKVRLSMKLFDSEGVSLLQTMEGGSKAIRAMRMEADELGRTLSAEQAADIAEIANSAKKMKSAFLGVANVITVETGPAIVELLTAISKGTPDAVNFSIRALSAWKVFFYELGADALQFGVDMQLALSKITFGDMSKAYEQDAREGLKRVVELRVAISDELQKQIDLLEGKEIKFDPKKGKAIQDVFNPALQNSTTQQASKVAAEVAKIIASTRTPLEEHQAQIMRLNELWQANSISTETYERAVTQSQDRFTTKSKQDAIEWADAWSFAGNRFSAGIGDAVGEAIIEQKNFSDAMRSVARGVVKQVISSLVEIGIKKIALSALSKTALAVETAASVAAGTTTAVAWAPAAAAVSLASFGANSVPASAGIATTFGLAKSLSLIGMAHDGLDFVPKTGTYLLEKGERVIKKEDNKQMKMAGNLTVNFNINTPDVRGFDQLISGQRGQIIGMIQSAYNDRGVTGGPLG